MGKEKIRSVLKTGGPDQASDLLDDAIDYFPRQDSSDKKAMQLDTRVLDPVASFRCTQSPESLMNRFGFGLNMNGQHSDASLAHLVDQRGDIQHAV